MSAPARSTRAQPPGNYCSVAQDGVTLAVRLTPRGGRDSLEGVQVLADGRRVIKARVAATASEGAANAALIALLARALAVAPRDVHIIAGQAARQKRIRVDGDGKALHARLTAIVAAEAG
ncbi:MAG: DUF167 domain-containing protein [Proteobacteria bacterium]|nr:DUF167 domain-containing protein [Pseudomonadota bacterium]